MTAGTRATTKHKARGAVASPQSPSTPMPSAPRRVASYYQPIHVLPKEVQDIKPNIDELDFGDGLRSDEARNMISPNPIIVNNSGIEGIFDIQRVIITFVDHEKLRARVRRAFSPDQKITGWCKISTASP